MRNAECVEMRGSGAPDLCFRWSLKLDRPPVSQVLYPVLLLCLLLIYLSCLTEELRGLKVGEKIMTIVCGFRATLR
jgi:hypothetical protein